jgi:hypothetical protein
LPTAALAAIANTRVRPRLIPAVRVSLGVVVMEGVSLSKVSCGRVLNFGELV